jgi:DNA primase
MNIPKELISDAKNRIGDRAADIIARGLNVSRWDTRNLKGCCPKHNEKTPSFTWNKKGYYFKCFGCGITYDIVDYFMEQERNFIDAAKKLFSEANMSFDFDTEKQRHDSKAKKDYKAPKAETNTSRTKAEEYLLLRKISKETLDYAEVKQDLKGNIVFEFKDQSGKLLTVKYRPARKIVKPEIKHGVKRMLTQPRSFMVCTK